MMSDDNIPDLKRNSRYHSNFETSFPFKIESKELKKINKF